MFDTATISPSIPVDLDEMPPGPRLAVVLAGIDVRSLAGHDRVTVLRAHRRMAAHHDAMAYDATAAVAGWYEQESRELGITDPASAFDSAVAEVQAALRLTRRAAESDVMHACDLTRELPRVWEALRAGLIDFRRAWVIAMGTSHLDAPIRRLVVDEIIDRAPGWTTGQLRARLRQHCLDTDPDDAALRYRTAVEHRQVTLQPTVDGTADLYGTGLPPDRAQAAMARIHALALAAKVNGDDRNIDQIRADVLLDLLEGAATPGRGVRGTVDLRVDLATLAGLRDRAGELNGYGPVVADIARQVAEGQPDAEWRFGIVDPDTGAILQTGTTRRRPTAAQRRHVEMRDLTCIFPGCRMPATQSDLDHTTPWAQQRRTGASGLGPLCRHHHVVRHRAGWSYERLPDGDYLWTSPLHHTYTTGGQPP